jgi:hypothetical protein
LAPAKELQASGQGKGLQWIKLSAVGWHALLQWIKLSAVGWHGQAGTASALVTFIWFLMTRLRDNKMLKDLMKDWTDFDEAELHIAQLFGLIPEEMKMFKGIMWSNNLMGNMLGQTLMNLVDIGFLEENEEGKFRYNVNWKLK